MNVQRGVADLREQRLHAYYDGELSGFSRWRFERELRRSASLRRELAGLQQLGDGIRQRAASLEAPDLWDTLALRLPALDARRAEQGPAAAARSWGVRESWWLRPVGALAASVALVAALLLAVPGAEPPVSGGVVRWIDSGSRSVMVLDDQPDTTIIWVLDGAGEGAAWGFGSEQV